MAEKKLILVLNASSEYIKHNADESQKYMPVLNKFFEAINETYLPLIKMFESLEKSEIPFKVALVLSPVVCTLLEDSDIQKSYYDWISKRIEIGKKELENSSYNSKVIENIKRCLEKNQKSFEIYKRINGKIVKKFLEFHKKGFVELLATCGTDIFLPHYHDIPEVINAQVETGYFAYKAFFGETPDGFWLPELGYYQGIEKYLRSYGFNYTFLDSISFLFSEEEPKKGIFSPARFQNSLVAFGRYDKSDDEIFGDENGFCNNENYLELNRDIGFELSQEKLSPFIEKGESRYSFGYKYWSKNKDQEVPYDFDVANEKVKADAKSFLSKKAELLSEAEKYLPAEKEMLIPITFDLNELRSKWAEGIVFIEEMFKNAASCNISFSLPKECLSNRFSLQKIKPCYGSSSGFGYGEDLLSSKNNWMMRYIRKASERMVDLSSRFPDDSGLKARLLNLGAKELLIAQSCGWAKMIEYDDCPEYAEVRFKQSINDFTAVFDALGSRTVSTEWLTQLEIEHPIFSWINYKIFNHRSEFDK